MKILPLLLLLATSLASFAQTDSTRPPDLLKAMRIYHTGNYGGAIVSLNRAVEAAPKNSEVYLYYALCYMGKDDEKEAMRNFNKAIELDPKSEQAFKGRGKLKARMFDYRGSIMDFDRAVEIDSAYSDAYFNRGLAYFNLRDYEASISDFTQVIGFNAKDFEAYYARGKAHDAAGKTSNACKDWSKSAELGFFDAYDVIRMKCSNVNIDEPRETEPTWKGNGTGFFIDIRGYVATNYHVIKNANEIDVEFIRDGIKLNYKAMAVLNDKQNDLSIIRIEDTNFVNLDNIPYNFSIGVADVATKVFALGYPMAISLMGTEIKYTEGTISSKTGFQNDVTTYQISVPIQNGNSGGPLFDVHGNLLGVTSSGLRNDIADNVNYAIKTSYLKTLVDVLPQELNLPSDQTISKLTQPDKVKVLSNYVVLIRTK